jgi:CHAD domain-containing protein
VESFLGSPTPENVHDLRTAVRRVEAALNLLPKKFRKRAKFRQYQAFVKKVFKATTPIRDIDTVITKLESHRAVPRVQDALMKLDSERRDLVAGATKPAKAFDKTTPPKLKKGQVLDAKVRKRRRKVVEGLDTKLHEGLPVILGDTRKLAELHDLRKVCKELRYTLEILPLKREQRLIKLLRDWQTILGDVRDNDITEKYITETGLGTVLSDLIIELQMSRDKMFGSFVHSAKIDSMSPKAKSVFSLISYSRTN